MNALRRQIQSQLTVETRPGGFTATLVVDPGLLILPDHFPERPVLPAICIIQAVLLAAAAGRGEADLRLRVLKNAKLIQPVSPGDRLDIDASMTAAHGDDIVIKARLSVAGRRTAEISLIAAKGASS